MPVPFFYWVKFLAGFDRCAPIARSVAGSFFLLVSVSGVYKRSNAQFLWTSGELIGRAVSPKGSQLKMPVPKTVKSGIQAKNT